jgi:hypothetical protein
VQVSKSEQLSGTIPVIFHENLNDRCSSDGTGATLKIIRLDRRERERTGHSEVVQQ